MRSKTDECTKKDTEKEKYLNMFHAPKKFMLSWDDGPIIGKQKFTKDQLVLAETFLSVIIDQKVTSHNKKLTTFLGGLEEQWGTF